ncbi:MAG: DUF4367 domain-containing protein [Oscillospiraceae bacterium]|nr:DUF4367 domain-containing protein [Oscillospiraceae bacterium]
MREIKTCANQKWKQLPTEELDQILQAELEKEHPDEEVVLPILHILQDREKDYPVAQTPEVLTILEKLSEYETSTKQSKNRRRWVAWVAAAAAAACIVVMALPRTVGAESIFDVLMRWTNCVFEFIYPDKNENYPNTDGTFETDHIGLQQLHNKVTELGVTESVVPMWLPEEFELIDLKVTSLRDGGYKVEVAFKGTDKFISFSYRMSGAIATKFEKEKTAVELFDYADISHFILQNDENLSVTWTVDGVECLMNTNMEKESVYTIIKSIYRRPLK